MGGRRDSSRFGAMTRRAAWKKDSLHLLLRLCSKAAKINKIVE
jgi:hypothetical protein